MEPISIYLHIPFCKHRCGYCDFNTFSGLENLIPNYVEALIEEIKDFSSYSDEILNVHTIFFGGGTPSLLEINQIEKILYSLKSSFNISDEVEISLEANPGTVDQNYLSNLFALGVNRLSLGVQSANPVELKLLERIHGYKDTIWALEYARIAGFKNISLDLIFGLPNQTLSDWKNNLEHAIELEPEHISLYALTIEDGTALKRQIKNNELPMPDDDLAADMYEWTMNILGDKDFMHYEISNWAKNNVDQAYQAKHNLQYWRNKPYIGFGAGAHSFFGGFRFSNILSPGKYIKALKEKKKLKFPFSASMIEYQKIDIKLEMQETMMMGLRLLNEGISKSKFSNRFSIELEIVFRTEIDDLLQKELLFWGGENKDQLTLTKKGCLLGNQVFMRFIE